MEFSNRHVELFFSELNLTICTLSFTWLCQGYPKGSIYSYICNQAPAEVAFFEPYVNTIYIFMTEKMVWVRVWKSKFEGFERVWMPHWGLSEDPHDRQKSWGYGYGLERVGCKNVFNKLSTQFSDIWSKYAVRLIIGTSLPIWDYRNREREGNTANGMLVKGNTLIIVGIDLAEKFQVVDKNSLD